MRGWHGWGLAWGERVWEMRETPASRGGRLGLDHGEPPFRLHDTIGRSGYICGSDINGSPGRGELLQWGRMDRTVV